ncbi:D-alanyl-D-alanine carboxypeptidase family protein [Clostridium thermarum]|uniref:D-alanyl-D-alanine carboxypeptidase family protein n=1 Tax=Clostridium thermarum TaxID=1716543 RepID=UPI00112085BA
MHVKNYINFLLAFIVSFTSFFCVNVNAEPENVKPPYIEARNAIAIDAKTNRVLYEKNAHILTPMASTTKIVTALVALKYGDLNKKVTISAKAANIRGSVVGYKKGEEISLRELIYGLMLRSGNDAAIAIAEGISGSVEQFVQLMNEYATEIGLVDTHFESPHGLDSSMHYTTAYDLALATAKAKEIKEFNEIVSVKDVDAAAKGFSRGYHNINKILWQIPEANGVKTGYTGQAGKCLVTSVNKGGSDIIIVVINCPQRWRETKKINEFISKTYDFKLVIKKGEIVKSLCILPTKKTTNLVAKEDIRIPIKKGSAMDVQIKTPKDIEAPIYKDEKVGTINIYEDNDLIYTSPLCTENEVLKEKGIKKWYKFFK